MGDKTKSTRQAIDTQSKLDQSKVESITPKDSDVEGGVSEQTTKKSRFSNKKKSPEKTKKDSDKDAKKKAKEEKKDKKSKFGKGKKVKKEVTIDEDAVVDNGPPREPYQPEPMLKKQPTSHIPSMCLISDYDSRDIKTILLPNKMRVVLISDPLAQKSAASLDIGIGNIHNPSDYNGLATFVAHLILCGSKKFSDVKGNDDFFSRNNGSLNVFTGLDNTNFSLEMDNQNFSEGMDRFANCFAAPLFNNDS